MAFDELFTPPGARIALSGVWIAVRMNDPVEAAQDRFYIEGVGVEGRAYPYISGAMPSDTDPCKGYVPTINDPNNPEYDPDFTFTFYYDREMAAKYGMAQALQNDQEDIDETYCGRVSLRVPSTVPFANFYYPEIGVDYDGDGENDCNGVGTGSAVFVSEAIWMGGLPMVVGNPMSCSSTQTVVNGGWRYCNETGLVGASKNWSFHSALINFFTDQLAPAKDPGVPNTLIENWGNTPGTLLGDITWDEINVSLSRLNDGGNLSVDASAVSDIVQNGIGDTLHAGDYMWVDSVCNQAISNDCPDPNNTDPHGFVVVGWAEIFDVNVYDSDTTNDNPSCESLMELARSGNLTLYDTYNGAIAAGKTNVVPFVVDFPAASLNHVPRPFYCSWLKTSTRPGFFRHSWHFYSIPSQLIVPVSELYVSPEWNWTVTDGNPN